MEGPTSVTEIWVPLRTTGEYLNTQRGGKTNSKMAASTHNELK